MTALATDQGRRAGAKVAGTGITAPSGTGPADVVVAGTVVRVMTSAESAFVRLDSAELVTAPQALLPGGVRFDQVFAEGMRVTGVRTDAGLRVDIPAVDSADLAKQFPAGCVTLATVQSVSRGTAYLALHPSVPVLVSRRDVSSNPLDQLVSLLSAGDVVLVRVLHHTDGTLRFRLHDVDDDEPVVPPLALLPGGPEWLRLESAETSPAPQDDLHEPASGLPVVAVVDEAPDGRRALQTAQLTIAAKQAQIEALEAEVVATREAGEAAVEVARQENQRVQGHLRDERSTVSDLRRQLRELKRSREDSEPEGPRDRRPRFLDEEEWLRHELYLAWIARYEPSDRRSWRLPEEFVVGPRLLASLETLTDECLDKALKAMVDVLTGRAKDIPGRQLHALRVSVVGNAPDLVRDDGARCMRCAIEQGVPSARRLHYWVRRDGVIELGRVVLHEDMEP